MGGAGSDGASSRGASPRPAGSRSPRSQDAGSDPRSPAPVPQHRSERLARLGSMLAGIAGDTALELLRRAAGRGEGVGSPLLTRSSAQRLTDTLADLRGAAMKLGQLLSMQGADFLPPTLRDILADLQDRAFLMPESQVREVMRSEFGPDWEPRFAHFDFEALAAASIGQVHAATTPEGRDLVLKLQYPGVDESIDGDVDSLVLLLRALRLLPADLDVDELVPAIKRELHSEADYRAEADNTEMYRELVRGDALLFVPRVHRDLSTRRVLATDRVRGVPIEDLRSREHACSTRDAVGAALLGVVLREFFEFHRVQTDPNFANYLYDLEREAVALIDFGSLRALDATFAAAYEELVCAALAGDARRILAQGMDLRMLPPDATLTARADFVELCEVVAEPLRPTPNGVYDFGTSDLPARVRERGVEAWRRSGLPPLPAELIFLHRKLAGTYLLLAHIGARVDGAGIFARVRSERGGTGGTRAQIPEPSPS